MDMYGLAGGVTGTGYGLTDIPLGYEMAAMAGHDPNLVGYAGLSETDKEHMILRCKDAQNREEMERIVDTVAPGMNVQALLQEDGVPESLKDKLS
mgnify:FL=1